MAETKHGGSPASGIIMPAGIEQHEAIPGSVIVMPEIARTNAQAKERALQFERRRLALDFIASTLASGCATDNVVTESLNLADELMTATGGVV